MIVANPARGNFNVSLSPFAPEDVDSRDRFGRRVPRQYAHSPHPVVLPSSLLFSAAASIIHTANRHRVSPEFIGYYNAIVFRWRLPPRVHRHRASSLQGSSINGLCLFRCPHGPINICSPLFSHIRHYYWYIMYVWRRSTIGGGEDVTNLSPFWEETAQKHPIPGTYLTNPLVK